MSHDIFISHSSKDKLIADAICHILEERGIRCWIAPRDIQPGAPYARSLVEAIETSKAMVLIFSSHSCSSDHVMRELEQASKHGIAVIPFRIDDTSPPPEMDYHISRLHWIDALTKPLEEHINRLGDYIIKTWDVKNATTRVNIPAQPKNKISSKVGIIVGILSVLLIIAIFSFTYFQNDSNAKFFDSSGGDNWHELSICGTYSQNIGNFDEALKIFQKQENISRSSNNPEGLANALGKQGYIHYLNGDLNDAMTFFIGQERVSKEGEIWNETADSLGNQGLILLTRGDSIGALDKFNEEEQIALMNNGSSSLANAYRNLGNINRILGNLDLSLEYFRKQEQVCQQNEDTFCQAESVGQQGDIFYLRGDNESAISQYKKEFDLCNGTDNIKCILESNMNQGKILLINNNLDNALETFTEQASLYQSLNDKHGNSIAFEYVGLIYLKKGDMEKAKQNLEKAEQLSKKLGNYEHLVNSVLYQGKIYFYHLDYDNAMLKYKESERNARQIDYSLGIIDALLCESDVELIGRNNPAKANSLISEALRIAEGKGFENKIQELERRKLVIEKN